MKVLLVIPSIEKKYGGPVTNVLNMATHMIMRRIEVTIMTISSEHVIQKFVEHEVDGRVYRIPLVACVAREHIFRYSGEFRIKLNELAQQHNVVLIHGLWQFPCSYAGWYCRKSRIPYVIFTHAMLSSYSYRQKALKKMIYFWLIEKQNLNNANTVMFMDELERQHAISLGIHNRSSIFESALNQSDLSSSKELESRAVLSVSGPLKVLYYGRVHPKKGLHLLVKAVSTLVSENNDINLSIAGPVEDRVYFETIKKATEKLNLIDKIKWLGMIKTKQERKEFFHGGDVFVLPSEDDSTPVALLEAMASGLPVVITPGCKFSQVDPFMGRVVANSSREIADALKEMVNNRKNLVLMGNAAHEYVSQKYMWRDRIELILDKIHSGALGENKE